MAGATNFVNLCIMHLIPSSILVKENNSQVKVTPKHVRLTLEIEFCGSGDFSGFVVDGKIDAEKIAVALIRTSIPIEPPSAAEGCNS
jgi:hypothetical protein